MENLENEEYTEEDLNKEYAKEINTLIPEAERYADEMTAFKAKKYELRRSGKTIYKWDYWTEHFHRKMNELARERGLR
jgi:hypothetical protein